MARSRRMPSMGAVAAHHRLAVGVCARCSVVARCERAHVIDRTLGGLDDVQNLRPLCYPCHRDQPVFGPGEESVAMLWFELPTELAWYVAR